MRRLVWLGLLVASFPHFAAAEENVPKVEIFGGYSFFRMPSGFAPESYASTREPARLNGWDVSAVAYLNRWIGVEADFGGYYGSAQADWWHYPSALDFDQGFNIRTYLFGPRLSYRGGRRFTPFIHALFGRVVLARAPVSNTSESSFLAAIGGGCDIGVSRRLSVRAIQADYLKSRLSSAGENSVRLSAGVLLGF